MTLNKLEKSLVSTLWYVEAGYLNDDDWCPKHYGSAVCLALYSTSNKGDKQYLLTSAHVVRHKVDGYYLGTLFPDIKVWPCNVAHTLQQSI